MVSAKLLVLFSLTILAVAQAQNGAPVQLSGKEKNDASKLLEDILQKLAVTEGPAFILWKTRSVTRQIVSGTLYDYDAELVDDKPRRRCNVKVLVKSDYQITISCPNEKQIVRRLSNLELA